MTTPTLPNPTATVPAQVGFLAIYNPSLGTTDETIDDQIVYYASVNTQSQKRRYRSHGRPTADISSEERNERLRQIGLAQGMVEFSRGFSNGQAVDTIETEKTRVLLQELEPGWWILASIDLSKIPLPPRIGPPGSGKTDSGSDNVEYSSRELKPSTLLMRDLLRAHSIFLLHHAPSLSAMFVKYKRANFVKILGRFWDLFLSTWDVMLHGNPATNVFRGIKLAACGELGVGVGEEDRGSGEREVLEGFVDRIEGLTDLVVSKFGASEDTSALESANDGKSEGGAPAQWLGTGEEPGAEDGAIFLGVGALSRKSLCDIANWMEDMYTWGENAYGVKERPTSTRQTRKRRKSVTQTRECDNSALRIGDRTATPASPNTTPGERVSNEQSGPLPNLETAEGEVPADEGGMTKLMSYLKMGYGTHWTLGSSEGATQTTTPPAQEPERGSHGQGKSPKTDSHGHYLIGLLGDMEETNTGEREGHHLGDGDAQAEEYDARILLRTVTVELDNLSRAEVQQVEDLGSQNTELILTPGGSKDYMDPNSKFDSQDRNKSQKMRVVVYVNKPFIFTFLFRNRTDSLDWEGLYRSLHHQLAPLRKPLAISTKYRPSKPDVGGTGSKETAATATSRIFDLIWDPKAMTIHSTIPNIPTPAEIQREKDASLVWSRAEAVNTHNQILNVYAATLTDYSELERTCKTNRGWWVVWTRIMERDPLPPIPHPQEKDEDAGDIAEATAADDEASELPATKNQMKAESGLEGKGDENRRRQTKSSQLAKPAELAGPKPKVSKEIFLIRRAGQHHNAGGLMGIAGGGGAGSEAVSGGGGWAEGASRLAQGIGIDTAKYIEALLSIGR